MPNFRVLECCTVELKDGSGNMVVRLNIIHCQILFVHLVVHVSESIVHECLAA